MEKQKLKLIQKPTEIKNKHNELIRKRVRLYTPQNENGRNKPDLPLKAISKIYDTFKEENPASMISIYGQGPLYTCIFDTYKNLVYEYENYIDGETTEKIEKKFNTFYYIDVVIDYFKN
jgi:hypothetical protein